MRSIRRCATAAALRLPISLTRMARIAFCWELGGGFGHITPYLPLIRSLATRGDEVFFLGKDKQRVGEVFKDLPVEVAGIEPGVTAPADRIRGADSYPEILYNCGFHDEAMLYRRVSQVAAAIASIAPDLLVVDFAPTAMLANRHLRLPLISAGNGFGVPIRSTPMPRFRYWQGAPTQTLVHNEGRVLDVINAVLVRLGWPRLNSIAELLQADGEWLKTFAELDFYGARDGARYLGCFPPDGFGQVPVWPSDRRPRVFAYLAPGATATTALRALEVAGAAVCLYAPKLTAAEQTVLDPGKIHLADTLVDVTVAGREAELFVTNGNMNTLAAGLLAGKAQLALPTTAEKYLTGRRLELLGAGLAAPQAQPGDIPAKLRALLSDGQYTRAAVRFADKYRRVSAAAQTAAMLDDVDRIQAR